VYPALSSAGYTDGKGEAILIFSGGGSDVEDLFSWLITHGVFPFR
jgi:hypothetical protein